MKRIALNALRNEKIRNSIKRYRIQKVIKSKQNEIRQKVLNYWKRYFKDRKVKREYEKVWYHKIKKFRRIKLTSKTIKSLQKFTNWQRIAHYF